MQGRMIGSLKVSALGLGCNNFGFRCEEDVSISVIHAAVEAGVTFFDTADVYAIGRSEEILGRALAGHRDDVIIATKFGARFGDDPAQAGASAQWLAEAVEASLRRLATDYIDLYQQHVPDDTVPIEETQAALDQLVHDGKVREIGTSNVTVAQIDAAAAVSRRRGWAQLASVQNRFSLLAPEALDDVIPACDRTGMVLIPYAPLAGGLLSGKYERAAAPPEGTRLSQVRDEHAAAVLSSRNFNLVDALRVFADERGHSLLELAIGWLASEPVVGSVIAGATSPAQVRANATAVEWALSADDRAGVARVLSAHGR